MRKVLDTLYLGSGVLAGVFLVAIGTIVLLQVGANVIDALIRAVTGEPLGLLIPNYAEFAGFFLASSSFLALAYTFRAGGHIRVSMLIRKAQGNARRAVELWCTGSATALSAYFTYYTLNLVLESLEFGDVSVGMVPVKLWIPQLAMLAGLVVLTIALIDQFVIIARGGAPSYVVDELDEDDDTAPDRRVTERQTITQV